MAILQVRDIDDRMYESLKRLSQQHRRSVSQEVIHILESYLSDPEAIRTNATDEFVKLAGAWEDERSAEEIIADMKGDRSESDRFSQLHGVFD
jgi:plasmid stability protein